MRTSPSQFESLVTYMEQHGDLCKTISNAQGRISNIQNWEALTEILNSDTGGGDTKTTEKWKKVWSDFKNNIKKKNARLGRAATGPAGSRPAGHAKLSDLEQRVLNLMGLQAATGLAVEEAGLSQNALSQPSLCNNDNEQSIIIIPLHQVEEFSDTQIVIQTEANIASSPQSPPPPSSLPAPSSPPPPSSPPSSPPPPSLLRALSSPFLKFLEQEVENSQPNEHEPGSSRTRAHSPPEARPAPSHIPLVEPQDKETRLPSSTRPTTRVRVGHGLAESVQTSSCRAKRTRTSHRRRAKPAQTDQTKHHFLQADSFWRNFKEQQHRDSIELRREENRIRELEVQAQRGWQAIGGRLVNVLEKLADKYCKD